MNDLQNLFGNILSGPWTNAQAINQYHQSLAGFAAQQQAAQSYVPTPVASPEDCRQHEIKRKNERNYAHWQARILRDPLTDCEAK